MNVSVEDAISKTETLVNSDSCDNPREAVKRKVFSDRKWFQNLFTELSGKPYAGQQPAFQKTSTNQLIQKAFVFCCSICVMFWSTTSGYIWMTFLGQLLLLHSFRWFRLTFMHACSHNAGIRSNRHANVLLGSLVAVLTLSGDFDTYCKDHRHQHHQIGSRPGHLSLLQKNDETYRYLLEAAGFQLGATVSESWQHLIKTLCSPTFHAERLCSRLQATFLSPNKAHDLAAVAIWLVLMLLIYIEHNPSFAIAYLVTVTILFECSSLLRQCVEHRWPVPDTGDRGRTTLGVMTSAIILCESPPCHTGEESQLEYWLSWVCWWARVFFYHLPSRLLILTGDSPVHDWHHRNPSGDWPNSIYHRQADAELPVNEWGKYQETFGLLRAIQMTFVTLSFQSPRDLSDQCSAKG
ncbi:hypothetical protein S7335_369 [Synechococcus sp. PCC 7335]|uniref:fatty acid desaturase n=1 Tax=Synechococcus sp. (strain ATCC 29403 / PCC 7335) TaxID=91464 RepID=UPI00017EBC97|nr:fatty acid desaturase [Synechococcus sp. PCC 7335]EDX83022.1 hypothetical protein S7335_200 [Synechococcus sp. PCC 7335]EDX83190.1 hypothetical protein S7335_369 [Synechococcus sp. PCC 7335]